MKTKKQEISFSHELFRAEYTFGMACCQSDSQISDCVNITDNVQIMKILEVVDYDFNVSIVIKVTVNY